MNHTEDSLRIQQCIIALKFVVIIKLSEITVNDTRSFATFLFFLNVTMFLSFIISSNKLIRLQLNIKGKLLLKNPKKIEDVRLQLLSIGFSLNKISIDC